MPHDSPGLSLDSSGSRLSSPSEASLQKGDPCTETPHLPTNQHDDSQSSAGGYPPASPNLETTSGVTANVREGGCGGHDSAKQVPLVDSPITNQVSTRHTEVSENEFSDEESRTHTTTEITTETTTVSSGKTLPLGKRPERAENNRAKIKTSTVDSDKSQLLTQVKMASHYRQKVHSSSASGEGEVDSQVDKSEKEQNSGASSTVHVSTRHSIRSISKDTHTNDSKSHSQIAPVPCDDIPISLSIEGKNASSGQNEREEATHIASHTIGVGSHISDDGQHQLSVNGPVAPSANNKDETLAVSHESSLTETHTRSSSSRSSTQQRDVSRSSVFAALQGRQLETSSRIRLAAESPEFDQRITINVDDSRETGASFGGSKAEHVTSTESTSRETVATSHEHIPVTEIGGATSVQIFDQLSTHSSNTTFENSNSSERKVSYRGTASNSSHVSTSQGATREVSFHILPPVVNFLTCVTRSSTLSPFVMHYARRPI